MPSAQFPGPIIRNLRQERNLSIESLALESGITPLALSNLERHSTRTQRENLIKILDALEKAKSLLISERRSVLECSGYTDTLGLPNNLDIARAVAVWQETFGKVPYPAYLIDVAQRLHEWSAITLTLLGRNANSLSGTTLFDLMFSLPEHSQLRLVNEGEVVFKVVLHIWNDCHTYGNQDWCQAYLKEAEKKYPAFKELYDSVERTDLSLLDVSTMGPVLFSDPKGNILRFQVVGVDMVSDPRFRIVQYLPIDVSTLQLLSEAHVS